ncbi:MAG: hypothetical protein GY765_36195, partial [bacterium]|nr:hypothetical protein [bacterium]
MKVFAQKMAELFAHDLPFNVDGNYPATIKLDTACRFACHLLGASSTSLLLYSGSDDKLFCRGRYINSRNIFQPSQPNRELREMLKYICVYNFIYRARSINKRVNADALFDDYKKSILKGGDISKTNFGKIFEDYHKWEKPYGKYRAVVGNEYYKVDKSTLTGGFYKKLLGLEPEYKMEMVVQDIRQLQNEKKYYCINPLRDKLKLTFYSKYYVALPLFANGHYFGVLRFLFPHNTGIFDHAADNQLLVKDEYKKQFQYIAQIVSLHLE